MQSSNRSDEVLAVIAELVADSTKKALGDDGAEALSEHVVSEIRATFGGEAVYFCKGRANEADHIKNQIWNDFTGSNYIALSKKYGYTTAWIYQVTKEMGARKRAEIQLDIFGDKK